MSQARRSIAGMNSPITTYLPSTYFHRQALRSAKTKKEAVKVGLQVVLELEMQREWVREQGLMPPKFLVRPCELEARTLAEVIPFPTIVDESETAS